MCLSLACSPKLLPIGPALILTLHAHAHATKLSCVAGPDSSLQCPSSAHYNASDASHCRKTWQDYIKESAEQIIEGSEEEQRWSEERFRQMEKYLQRWVSNHDMEEKLNEQCTNKHQLCVYWASDGECELNPMFMEEECILACQRCDHLIDDIF
ncbi:hypothetical protein HJC23_008856 [Cyclotella cryptica]|uniref:ShKT domain-containing protein n=1 Tax=Cyclotella cryptica TaxID=29204 RepID=A0ABD3NM77_9STRA